MVSVICIKGGGTCIWLNRWWNLLTQQNQETFGGKYMFFNDKVTILFVHLWITLFISKIRSVLWADFDDYIDYTGVDQDFLRRVMFPTKDKSPFKSIDCKKLGVLIRPPEPGDQGSVFKWNFFFKKSEWKGMNKYSWSKK